MPVEIKKRRADALEAAIFRAVLRISRTSRFMSCVLMPCLMIVIVSPNGDNLRPFGFGASPVLPVKKGNAGLAPHKASGENKTEIWHDNNWNYLTDERPARTRP